MKNKVLEFCEAHVQDEASEYGSLLVIEGEAGVGKSVVLSSIFNTIQERTNDEQSSLVKTNNYLVVNHEEMLKTYKGIARQVKHLKASHFSKPTPLINKLQKAGQKADIIFVDEAHLLLTKPDAYNGFRGNNHLEELLKLAKVVVIIYDEYQVLKLKSLWGAATLQQLKRLSGHHEQYRLTNQFRMQASEEIIAWIDAFKEKRVLPIPNDVYEVKVFETLELMHNKIKERNEQVGLSRVVSTFDYLHKKDGATYYVKESNGEYKMPWNTTNPKYTWAEKPETIHEAGSIYTVQGSDLNYVGVVLGPSVTYDVATERIVIKTNEYKDTGAYTGAEGIPNVEQAKEQIILNSINILMKRGVKGLYIYASDEVLRQKLLDANSTVLTKY